MLGRFVDLPIANTGHAPILCATNGLSTKSVPNGLLLYGLELGSAKGRQRKGLKRLL